MPLLSLVPAKSSCQSTRNRKPWHPSLLAQSLSDDTGARGNWTLLRKAHRCHIRLQNRLHPLSRVSLRPRVSYT